MNDSSRQSGQTALATGVWSLWIDLVGGYRIMEGNHFTVGGPGGDDVADIAVRTAWRRRMATLSRSGDDFWLTPESSPTRTADDSLARPIAVGSRLPIATEEPSSSGRQPNLRLQKPSPLSGTVAITLDPPHRFVWPMDAILLVDKTVLIGPEPTNHIRAPQMSAGGLVLVSRGGDWWIRQASGTTQPLIEGERLEISDLVMTIRRELTSPTKEKR